MKNRSHRLPVSEPRHDDWVDESWTVDCICGVNFDDGEEMVNCDECGVWVHTRCSRYVKSEKSFACDKCKNKNMNVGAAIGCSSIRNDSEETEVAEFLLELPTKTLGMENPTPSSVSTRRPFRLWTDIPMEERVHVQGVPGGDPGLFSGIKMSSVFGPELWRCTGYVPKKFNFCYTEFPCGDDGMAAEEKNEEMDNRNGEENVNQADNGAVVLVSLSKEIGSTLPTPVVDSVGVKNPVEGGVSREGVSPSYNEMLAGKNANSACPEDSVKESSSVQPIVSYSSKRKKEEMRMLKDQSAKKKLRTIEQERDVKKRAAHASKAASTFSSDARSLELSQDRGSKVVNVDIHRGKDVIADQPLDTLVECATNLFSEEHSAEATLRKIVSSDEISRERNKGDQVPVRFENFSKTHNGIASFTQPNGSRSTPAKDEVHGDDLRSCRDIGGVSGRVGIGSHDKEPVAVDVTVTGLVAKESETGQDTNIGDTNSRPNKKLKVEVEDDHISFHGQSLPLDDVKLDTMKETTEHSELSPNLFSEDGKSIEASVTKSESIDHKVHDGSRNQSVGNSRTDKYDESSGHPSHSNQEPTGSEGSLGARKRPSRLGHGSEVAEELPKSSGAVTSHSTVPYQRKVVVSVRKSASTSTSNISKFVETRTGANAPNPTIDSRLKGFSESSVETMKEKGNSSTNAVRADEKCVKTKKFLKESSRLNSVLKSQSTKSSNTSANRMSSDSKNPKIHSSKVSLVPDLTATPGYGESDSPQQVESTSNVQNKSTSSALPSKSEKFYQSGSRPSSRGNVASMTTPASSNIPATLSDQELALLLHQELNSSPRVPRVPRMRHAGSLPQLTCPTTASMLMKQTSSSGGKDHGVASKRKTKDFFGDGSHCFVEVDNETKKMDGKLSLPDSRRRDSDIDPDSRQEAHGGPIKGVHSMKTTNRSSSLSSSSDANGNNLSSSCPSSRNASDDDPRMVSCLTNRTLPGLIAEIMSEGKRMTYEELCNAVLPHWPHLRKHNGERYAYSSHSQAVLDCLRNRSEWARLVDRGPKTSASRKRRKIDADSVSIESEDNEEYMEKHAKDIDFESHQEAFPKGKRKARKRRRLALQGRGIVRRRRRAEVVSDDESESFSNSSEDIMSSEEEIQGNEASASSDEVL
ncbi:hypothetical protein ACJIZ3_003761 [Penstemon smallii]|uniref:Zinc finger PHD-type domain-containing protein n=1 Tax=Penstemon smallii TaxID=265156 RepID=A0ABD3S0A5_9LAMI